MPAGDRPTGNLTAFRAVKIAHTVVWVFFATSIFAILVSAWAGDYRLAAVFIVVVFVEVAVLALNGLRCPLTGLAARYAANPGVDIDIYIPRWLAHHNKLVFGTLYLLGILLTVVLWAGSRPGS